MDKVNALIKLNEAINKYFERQSLEAGNARYWPQMFVTSEMLNDEDLVKAFGEIFESPINKKDKIEGDANESRHKKTNVGRVPK